MAATPRWLPLCISVLGISGGEGIGDRWNGGGIGDRWNMGGIGDRWNMGRGR